MGIKIGVGVGSDLNVQRTFDNEAGNTVKFR